MSVLTLLNIMLEVLVSAKNPPNSPKQGSIEGDEGEREGKKKTVFYSNLMAYEKNKTRSLHPKDC
jgi:hypothetical protein